MLRRSSAPHYRTILDRRRPIIAHLAVHIPLLDVVFSHMHSSSPSSLSSLHSLHSSLAISGPRRGGLSSPEWHTSSPQSLERVDGVWLFNSVCCAITVITVIYSPTSCTLTPPPCPSPPGS
ncbi:hypothetical protein DAEQUDRAFT_227270 [Daedalea quercina L-15889]|uniref:Uncharacterized protein n=1 Tax=Daedalea quercina L-15889 TaxID=1314783 RepID=A0A165R1P4_9APHY|nr:hypothetical protein DAEQUDRAFT_227270 [Daedalea quercina L-15889]